MPKQKSNPNPTTTAPNAAALIKQTKLLLAQIQENSPGKYQMQIQKQIQVLRLMGQVNRLLALLPIQFVPYVVKFGEVRFVLGVFVRVCGNKEICLCVVLRVLQAYLYRAAGIKDKQHRDEAYQQLNQLISQYLDLCQLCLQFNIDKPIISATLHQSLQKLHSWCTISPSLQPLIPKITQIQKSNPNNPLSP